MNNTENEALNNILPDEPVEVVGVKFKDADLIGFPIRIVVGDKNLPNVEIKMRNQSEANLVPLEEATDNVVKMVQDELAKLNA